MKKKKWTKKKKIIFIIIAIVIVIFAVIKIKSASDVEEEPIEFEAIEKRDIATSISATGVITTSDSKNVVAPLTGSKIKTVDVEEGQTVAIGDVICTFDTSSLQENLSIAQASQNTTQAQANLGVQSAQRTLNDAIDNRNKQADSMQSDVNTAKSAYESAEEQLEQVSNALIAAEANLKNYQTTNKAQLDNYAALEADYNAKVAEQTQKESAYNSKKAEVDIATINVDPNLTNLEAELQFAENAMKIAQDNSIIAKTTLDNASSIKEQYTNLNKTVETLTAQKATCEAGVSQAKAAYEVSKKTRDTAVSTADSTVASMRDNLTNSELAASSASLAQAAQMNSLRDQIKEGIVKSTVNGTVTKVNVKPGDLYTGSTIAIVEGCEDFIIEAEIDEYDIPDVEVGMKVLIKTDATRDEELTGRVIYVASSATNSANSSMGQMTMTTAGSSAATYTVKIELETPNDRLRLGMNAKLSIITDSREKVWSVPYEAVYDREDGTSYIELLKDEKTEEKEELDITRGLEGTYYVEIKSDKLKEGLNVVLPKIEAENTLESLLQSMGADAGI